MDRTYMTAFGTFMGLDVGLKRLLLSTWLTMLGIRLKLWIIPVSQIHQDANSSVHHSAYDVKTLVWSVQAVAPYVPQASCLTQALTANQVLSKHGYIGRVKIGVAKDEQGEFEAHAWLEYEEEVVLGASEKEYVNLMDLENYNQ